MQTDETLVTLKEANSLVEQPNTDSNLNVGQLG